MEEIPNNGTVGVVALRSWQEPEIVLERSLVVSAQVPTPGPNFAGQPQGMVGPLSTSGGTGNCR